MMVIKAADTRTLWRAFDRLARSIGHPYNMLALSPEDHMTVCLELATELNRRAPRPIAQRLAVYGLYIPS